MIPADEQARLEACVREAWRLAEQGQVLRGYGVLKLGLVWAETPAIHPVTLAQSPPEPWAAVLADLYRRELLHYAAAYHAALESCCRSGYVDALQQELQDLELVSAPGPERPAQCLRVAQEQRQVH